MSEEVAQIHEPIKFTAKISVDYWPVPGSPERVTTVAVSEDGVQIICGCDDGSIIRWVYPFDTAPALLEAHKASVCVVKLIGMGKYLLTISMENDLRIWDLGATPIVSRLLSIHMRVQPLLDVSRNGGLAATKCNDLLCIWHIDCASSFANEDRDDTYSQSPIFFHDDRPLDSCFAFTPDFQFISAAIVDGSIAIFNISERSKKCSLRGHIKPITHLASSHDGRHLASAGRDFIVNLWDLVETVLISSYSTSCTPLSCSFSVNSQLLSICLDGQAFIEVWDLPNSRQGRLSLIEFDVGPINALEYIPSSSNCLVSVGRTGVFVHECVKEKDSDFWQAVETSPKIGKLSSNN
jgi:WD40 repeat protein